MCKNPGWGDKIQFHLTKFVTLDSHTKEETGSFYGYTLVDYGERVSSGLLDKERDITPQEAINIIARNHNGTFWSITNDEGFFFGNEWIKVNKDGHVID